jgi:predicted RNase H-like HicB family nuclease
MKFQEFRTIHFQQEDGSWAAETPEIPGCYALMGTREEAAAGWEPILTMITQKSDESADA